jgi:indole-3-glycerol phosphate synthase
MVDFLDKLAHNTMKRINNGYYDTDVEISTHSVSLKGKILESERIPIIAEIKAESPSLGVISKNIDANNIATAMENGGAVGISVLTVPKYFGGSLASLMEVRGAVKLPILMKDLIIDPIQLEAAFKIGANAVLIIQSLFRRGYSQYDVNDLIMEAHAKNLEVLLETHCEEEFTSAINTNADLIGINNRDLKTLKVDLKTTKRILSKIDSEDKVVVSESGIKTLADICFLKTFGAHAFLIGSTIMMASDIEKKVKEFVAALCGNIE